MGERDERRHLPTTPDAAEAVDVVQAVAEFVDDLVEEEAETDLDPDDTVAGGNGAT